MRIILMFQVDRMVKIWYENKRSKYSAEARERHFRRDPALMALMLFLAVDLPLMRSDSISPKRDEIQYSFIYIAHPRAVTGFSWRKTSKYMPRWVSVCLSVCYSFGPALRA